MIMVFWNFYDNLTLIVKVIYLSYYFQTVIVRGRVVFAYIQAKQAEIHGETSTLSLLGLLPQVHCISPVQVWNRRAKDDSDTVLADKDELQSVAYQRVYQFLKKHDNSENLDDVVFCSDTQGNLQEVIQVICKLVDYPASIQHFKLIKAY